MALRDALVRVLSEYGPSKAAAFGGHPLASFIRHEGAHELEQALGAESEGLLANGSAGAGNWAEVPWLAVFDPLVTDSATRGYYVVYLFHASGNVVHLSLNQGTTAVRQEFAANARRVLGDRAAFMRKRLQDFSARLPAHEIDLGSSGRLAGDYEAGHALGVTYIAASLPTELELRNDLQAAVRAYRALTFRVVSIRT
jgi:5-methylcytosine-specific restriction enzyme A